MSGILGRGGGPTVEADSREDSQLDRLSRKSRLINSQQFFPPTPTSEINNDLTLLYYSH